MDDYMVIEEYMGYDIIECQNKYYIRDRETLMFYWIISEDIHHAKRLIERLVKGNG